jgi:hypothetical protein
MKSSLNQNSRRLGMLREPKSYCHQLSSQNQKTHWVHSLIPKGWGMVGVSGEAKRVILGFVYGCQKCQPRIQVEVHLGENKVYWSQNKDDYPWESTKKAQNKHSPNFNFKLQANSILFSGHVKLVKSGRYIVKPIQILLTDNLCARNFSLGQETKGQI